MTALQAEFERVLQQCIDERALRTTTPAELEEWARSNGWILREDPLIAGPMITVTTRYPGCALPTEERKHGMIIRMEPADGGARVTFTPDPDAPPIDE